MLAFDARHYPYTSNRTAVYARKGMVATSQPLAAQAGLEILKKGGNAIDAAIATAACLTVVEPTSNGLGGDAFALVWSKDKLHGLNASGPSPDRLTWEAVKERGHDEMPRFGWIPVTVPGIPAAWVSLSDRFGILPFEELLAPAIEYAEHGYAVSPVLSRIWEDYRKQFEVLRGEEFSAPFFEMFYPNGRAPQPGEIWSSPDLAKSLQLIAESKSEAFYRGRLAEAIDSYSREHGGFLRFEDLARYKPEWVDPISTHYKGYDVWEIPPNGQGLSVLLALNILKGFEFTERDNVQTFHRQIEAMKLAFADARHYIAEPEHMKVSTEELLSDQYADTRRQLITNMASEPREGNPARGGTVYIATADAEGNMVSFIQSTYQGFGSGVVIPGTGISLHNRGRNFSMNPNKSNVVAPNKRPYHTIIPGFMTKGNQPVGPFGVMGEFMQPQGQVQVVMNTIDFHLNPQASLDAPRWQVTRGKTVQLERSVPEYVARGLMEKGHDIQISDNSLTFGRGQIIWRDPVSGVLCGGTDPRIEGGIAIW